MENIGIEPYQLLTQVINFTIMVLVLTKFLYKPILKILDERKKKIEEGVKFTEQMQRELEKSSSKREEIIEKAKDEATKIIEEGKKSGKQLEAEILEKARKETSAVIDKGRKGLESERRQMERELKINTVEIASSMVEKILADVLSEANHQAIIDKKLRQIAKLSK